MNSKENFSMNNASKILFQEHHDSGFAKKYGSLFPGIGYGGIYKISQRVYKFGGQPYVREYMESKLGYGKEKTAFNSFLLNGLSGSVMGAGEVCTHYALPHTPGTSTHHRSCFCRSTS